MKIFLFPKDILYILNCINITMQYMKKHTREEKKLLSFYFDFDKYDDEYYKLLLLHRIISLRANKYFYNLEDIHFTIKKNYIIQE